MGLTIVVTRPPNHFIINITWAPNHRGNPTWLPLYLLTMKRAIADACVDPCHVDVLGLSRGHCALMYCCSTGLHAHLVKEFRWFMVAAGCIWQQPDNTSLGPVREALHCMTTSETRRGIPMFAFICLSYFDTAVCCEGDLGCGKERARYQCHSRQIRDSNV